MRPQVQILLAPPVQRPPVHLGRGSLTSTADINRLAASGGVEGTPLVGCEVYVSLPDVEAPVEPSCASAGTLGGIEAELQADGVVGSLGRLAGARELLQISLPQQAHGCALRGCLRRGIGRHRDEWWAEVFHRPPLVPTWNLVRAKMMKRSSAITGMAHSG